MFPEKTTNGMNRYTHLSDSIFLIFTVPSQVEKPRKAAAAVTIEPKIQLETVLTEAARGLFFVALFIY